MTMKRLNIAIILLLASMAALVACASAPEEPPVVSGDSPDAGYNVPEGMQVATFAGGCFWCMEAPYEIIDGVGDVLAGYTGGHVQDPTYMDVLGGNTGHFEAVQIPYDPDKVSYEQLLDLFWRQINPTDAGGQFADRGSQYRTAIFYHNEEQKALAEQAKLELDNSGKFDEPVATLILPATEFYPAEDYHQDYYKKNSSHYESYKRGSGRAGYLERTWGN